MSVAAHHSPCIGAKRFFESAEAPEYGHGKRLRQPQQLGVSPPAGRARTGREGRAYVVTAAALAALRGLFPDMDEKVSNPCCWGVLLPHAPRAPQRDLARSQRAASDQPKLLQVVADVLDACGDNIDAAIKRLGELRLTARCNVAAEAQPGAQASSKAASTAAGACTSDPRPWCIACLRQCLPRPSRGNTALWCANWRSVLC